MNLKYLSLIFLTLLLGCSKPTETAPNETAPVLDERVYEDLFLDYYPTIKSIYIDTTKSGTANWLAINETLELCFNQILKKKTRVQQFSGHTMMLSGILPEELWGTAWVSIRFDATGKISYLSFQSEGTITDKEISKKLLEMLGPATIFPALKEGKPVKSSFVFTVRPSN